MNQQCIYCQGTLEPGNELCPTCGRWQPPSSIDYLSSNEPLNDAWEYEDPDPNATNVADHQGTFRRGQPLEPAAHQRRSLPPAANLTRPPFRQNSLAVKILAIVLIVAVVGLGGGAVAVVMAQNNPSSTGGHGAGAVPAGQTATPSPAAQATPTSTNSGVETPTPPATPTQPPINGQVCAAAGGPTLAYQGTPKANFVYDQFLPDDLPLKPLSVDQEQLGDYVIVNDVMNLAVGIHLPSAAPITICKITLRLVAFTPLPNNNANVLNRCGGVYVNPGGADGGGCGGGTDSDGQANLTFSSTQVGASVTALVTSGNNQPAQVTSNGVGVILAYVHFTTPGTYTFSIGLWTDASSPQFSTQTITQTVLVGHLGHYWGGEACASADMQALMPPPTNPPGAFVCPGSLPAQ